MTILHTITIPEYEAACREILRDCEAGDISQSFLYLLTHTLMNLMEEWDIELTNDQIEKLISYMVTQIMAVEGVIKKRLFDGAAEIMNKSIH